jgi:hypothetical protein
MQQEEAAKFLNKKAYEISYALCRIAAAMGQSGKVNVEESAFRIVSAAAAGDFHALTMAIHAAKVQVKLGTDTGIIRRGNGDLLTEEILKFELFLRSAGNLSFGKAVELGGIFSAYPSQEKPKRKLGEGSRNAAILEKEFGIGDYAGDRQSSEIRQSAIAEFIVKIGNCRMKDLVEQFPAISERTLRYDLQVLLGKGHIERVGEGGPSTYYRQKAATMPTPDVQSVK